MTTLTAAHDVIFLENRRTPVIRPKGAKYEPKPSEGKITKRRPATEAEEKVIRRGDWVRVNEHGDKPSDPGYKRKKSKVRPGPHTNSVEHWDGSEFEDMLAPMFGLMFAQGGSEEDGYDGVTHAGIALVAKDTGRLLLAQRAMDATDDVDVQETWEFPGGGLDDGEEAFEGAVREFTEETRLPWPMGEVIGGWRSDDGVYQGFVWSVDNEFPLANWTPTDEVQALTWVHRDGIKDYALRPEVEKGTEWDMIFGGVSGNEDEMDDEQMVAAMYTKAEFLQTVTDEYDRVREMNDDTEPAYEPGCFDLDMPVPVHGVVAPEEVLSGDGRGFGAGAMNRRPLALPLRDQPTDTGGHNGAHVVGRVDRMMRKGGMIHWEGALMPGEKADDLAEKIQFFGGRYGVSVDGDQGALDEARSGTKDGPTWFSQVRAAGLTAVDIPAFHQAYVSFGLHPEMPSEDDTVTASMHEDGNMVGRSTFDRGPGWVTNPVETNRIHDYWTKKGQPGYAKVGWGTPGDFTRAKKLIGAKIAEHSPDKMRFLNQIIAQWHFDALGYWPGDLGKPGNAPDTAENRRRAAVHAASEGMDAAADAAVDLVDGLEHTDEPGMEWETVLVSSAHDPSERRRVPLSYFHRHPDTGATMIDDPDEFGFRRTYGYAAEWGVCHIGMDGRCVEPPRTGSDDYPDFHLGLTRTDEGKIRTGLLTYGVGHRDANTILTESATQAHFDNIRNAWAAVRIGEDDRGIWYSGVVLPKVDEDDITLIQASGQVSGEWKSGSLRACLTVNVPGFPVVSASAEYDEQGNVMAMAASAFGQIKDAPCSVEDDPIGEIAVEVIERLAARERMHALAYADAMARFNAQRAEWSA